jgi:hypothetical protein
MCRYSGIEDKRNTTVRTDLCPIGNSFSVKLFRRGLLSLTVRFFRVRQLFVSSRTTPGNERDIVRIVVPVIVIIPIIPSSIIITLGVVRPLAVATGTTEFAGDIATFGEGTETPLSTAEVISPRDEGACSLNKQGIDVRRAILKYLLRPDFARNVRNVPAGHCQKAVLNSIVV